MGKCYCDYCDVFLTNDSVAVRKQHNEGNRHKYNVCEYYRHYMGQKLQEQIDDIVQQFEIRVSKGLVRPSYGLPPGMKAVKETGKATITIEQDRDAREPSAALSEATEKEPHEEQNKSLATEHVASVSAGYLQGH